MISQPTGFFLSQADVVLLSFVRANARRRLGFLTEFQRLNVALTRARRSLIVALERTGKTVGKTVENDGDNMWEKWDAWGESTRW